MKKLLIVDNGSSRCRWAFATSPSSFFTIETEGINPVYIKKKKITSVIKKIKSEIQQPDVIFFYSAGCHNTAFIHSIQQILEKSFKANVFIFHDLLGSARALFRDAPGIAGILGTGSSAGYYDGSHLFIEYEPGGYLVSDEGAATSIAKLFLKYYLSGKLLPELLHPFEEKLKVNPSMAIKKLYRSPSRFLSKVGKYICENSSHPFIIEKIAIPSFREYRHWWILPLFQKYQTEVGFTGSVAFFFRDVLKDVFKDIPLKTIKREVIQDLVLYHFNHRTI